MNTGTSPASSAQNYLGGSLAAWRLWILIASNLLIASAIASIPRAYLFVLGYSLGPAKSGILVAQLVLLSVMATLYPKRLLTGLLVAMTLAFLRALVTCRRDQVLGFIGLDEILRTLPVVAVLQGLRLFTGWRLSTESITSNRAGQFRIVELLDWMTTIGLALGCGKFLNSLLDRPIGILDVVLELAALPLLVGVPVALAILDERPRRIWVIIALVVWCLIVAAGLVLADLRHGVSLRVLLALFPRAGAPHLAMFLVTIVCNAYLLRRWGFRWIHLPGATPLEVRPPHGERSSFGPKG